MLHVAVSCRHPAVMFFLKNAATAIIIKLCSVALLPHYIHQLLNKEMATKAGNLICPSVAFAQQHGIPREALS